MQTKFAELEKTLLKEKEHLTSIIEVKEIDIVDLKTQNKALQEQKEVLTNKVTDLEQKTAPEPNIVPQKEIIDEIQKIISEEFTKKEILESRIGKPIQAIIVKDSDSFLKRFKNIASQGIQSVANSVNSLKEEILQWKEKYNNLMEVLKSKDQKIADLEEKLQTISTKQIEKENLNILKSLQSEAKRDGLDIRESEALFNKNQEEKTEEISSKKRDFGRSR